MNLLMRPSLDPEARTRTSRVGRHSVARRRALRALASPAALTRALHADLAKCVGRVVGRHSVARRRALRALASPAALTRGFTLIELMVAIAIFALLITLAAPMYGEFLANTQIRNAAENTLLGVRQAQAEAVKRNGQVQFVLATTGWQVVELETPSVVSSHEFAVGSARAAVVPVPGDATRVSFNGLGRVMPNPDASAPLTRVNVTTTMIAAPKNMSVIVSALGGSTTGMKLCIDDPVRFPPTDPQGCPP